MTENINTSNRAVRGKREKAGQGKKKIQGGGISERSFQTRGSWFSNEVQFGGYLGKTKQEGGAQQEGRGKNFKGEEKTLSRINCGGKKRRRKKTLREKLVEEKTGKGKRAQTKKSPGSILKQGKIMKKSPSKKNCSTHKGL